MMSMTDGQRLNNPKRTCMRAQRKGIHVDILNFPAPYTPARVNPVTAEPITAPAKPQAIKKMKTRTANVTRERASFVFFSVFRVDVEIGSLEEMGYIWYVPSGGRRVGGKDRFKNA